MAQLPKIGGVHRLLIVVAAVYAIACAYDRGVSLREDAVRHAESLSAEAMVWQKRAAMWPPDDQSRHPREARAEAKRLLEASDTAYREVPALWVWTAGAGMILFAATYLCLGAVWLTARWVWRGFQPGNISTAG